LSAIDRATAREVFGPDAAETIERVWADLTDDPLPEDVKERAVEVMMDGGVSGIPGQFVVFQCDPRGALADALGDDDPRSEVLRAQLDEHPDIWEFAGPVTSRFVPGSVETPPMREIERAFRRGLRRHRRAELRLRPARQREARTRPARRRSSTGTSLASTDPPAEDPDDLDDSGPEPGDAGPFGVPGGRR
jgi:hypothetical protein